MLQLNNIHKSYNRVIFDGVTFRFEPDKLYVLKGVSGSGKSTLFNIISGIDCNYEGSIDYCGEIVDKSRNSRYAFMEQIGYVFQHSLLYAHLTVKENLLFFNNDYEIIEKYSDYFNVTNLLNKKPSELSCGQRQMFSIIRALIQNKKILLADEPTASLDEDNSKKIAEAFEKLKTNGRTIIIATHEDCFDAVADEILYIENCKLRIEKNEQIRLPAHTVSIPSVSTIRKPHTFRYVLKKQKTIFNLNLLPLVCMIFILFTATAVQAVFPKEMLRIMTLNYPVQVFGATAYEIDVLSEKYPLKVYENYQIIDNDVTACALLEERESALYYQLGYGHFPRQDNEIIISQDYAKQKMTSYSIEECLNKTITFDGRTYKITGILGDADQNEKFRDALYSNVYYSSTKGILIFVTYGEAKTYGINNELPYKMVSLEGMNTDEEITKQVVEVFGGENMSYWGELVKDAQYTVDLIYAIILIVFCVIGIISMFFIINDTRLELHYRRKEIGYLRLFGVPKKRIQKMLVYERGIKLLTASLCAVVLYFVTIVILKIAYNINGMMPIYSFVAILVVLFLFTILSILLPCKKFLKQNIVSLIY